MSVKSITGARDMGHTLTSKGQVTIPKKIRDGLGLEPGHRVEFAVNALGEVVMRREGALAITQESIRKQLEKIRGTATTGLSTSDIMLLTRGHRI